MKICYRQRLTPPPQILHPWRERARTWGLFSTCGEWANNHHHQGQPCPHPAPLQPHRAAGPQKGQQGPPAVSPRGRHLPPRQQPTGGEQGATGGLARRASGTDPHQTRPKNGNWVLAKKTKGAGGCRRSACVSLAFDLLPVERSEWGIGGGVARRGVLHLCMEKC